MADNGFTWDDDKDSKAFTWDNEETAPEHPEAQPGAMQTRPGGPVINVNNAPGTIPTSGYATHIQHPATEGEHHTVGSPEVQSAIKTGLNLGAANVVGLPTSGIETEGGITHTAPAYLKQTAKGAASLFAAPNTTTEKTVGMILGPQALPAMRIGEGVYGNLVGQGKQAVKSLEDYYHGGAPGDLEQGVESGTTSLGTAASLLEPAKSVSEKVVKPIAGPYAEAASKAAGKQFGLGLTPEENLTKGIQPRAQATQFGSSLQKVLPDLKRYDMTVGKIKTLSDLHDAAPEIQNKIWDDEIAPVLSERGAEGLAPERIAKVQEAVRSSINPFTKEFDPAEAKNIEELADKLGKARTIADIMGGDGKGGLLGYINGKLASYFAKYPSARAADLMKNPDTAAWESARRALRSEAIDQLDAEGVTGIKDARERWGALNDVDREVERRGNVEDRKKGVTLPRLVAGAEGLGALASGHPLLAAGAAIPLIAERMTTPEAYIARGIKKIPYQPLPERLAGTEGNLFPQGGPLFSEPGTGPKPTPEAPPFYPNGGPEAPPKQITGTQQNMEHLTPGPLFEVEHPYRRADLVTKPNALSKAAANLAPNVVQPQQEEAPTPAPIAAPVTAPKAEAIAAPPKAARLDLIRQRAALRNAGEPAEAPTEEPKGVSMKTAVRQLKRHYDNLGEDSSDKAISERLDEALDDLYGAEADTQDRQQIAAAVKHLRQ